MSYCGHCTSHPVEYCTYAYQTHFPFQCVVVVGGSTYVRRCACIRVWVQVVHECVHTSEWPVEYCTYQTSLGWWCTMWLVGGGGGVHSICAGHVYLQQ